MAKNKTMTDEEIALKEEKSIKAIVKSKPRLAIFIVSIVLSLALIVSGVMLLVGGVDTSRGEPFDVEETLYEGKNAYKRFDVDTAYYRFTPNKTGEYQIESGYNGSFCCVVYDSDGDKIGYTHTGFDFTIDLDAGETYYLGLYTTTGYNLSGSITITYVD